MWPNLDYSTYKKLLKYITVSQYGMYIEERKRRLRGGYKRK